MLLKQPPFVLYVNFEESQEAMVSTMLSPGIDLRPYLQAYRLQISSALPESMGAEEHLVRLLKVLNTFQPDYVVVDAISSCIRMGSLKTSFDFVMRLINTCKERGTTIFLINQATGFTEEQEISGVGVSSMVDTVLTLRYINAGGEVNRVLQVMKSRGSKHSNQFREFLITDNGIDIVDVYVSDGGVLTGVARQEQEAKEAADYLLKQQEIKSKEKTLAQLRASIDAEAVKRKAELIAAEFEVEQLKLAQEVLYNGRNKRAKMRGKDSDNKRSVSIPAKSSGKGIKRKGGAK